MNQNERNFYEEYKMFNIEIEKVQKFDTPKKQGEALKKVSILKNTNVTYSYVAPKE